MTRAIRPALRHAIAVAACATGAASAGAAELELGLYGGVQTAPHSVVSGSDPELGGDFEFSAKWEGKSFALPPYWGARATWWRDNGIGFGVEVTHAKTYADDATRADNGFDRLEFTDGHNIVTANLMKRWPDAWGRMTPYVGAGLGFAMPHVDITPVGGSHTFGYQITGPAVRWTAGASYDLSDRWALFGEYQGTYSVNRVDLDGGGILETNIVTNALNLGVSYRF